MKPILFSTEMVRAILDGRKTVTRRVVKPQPPETDPHNVCFDYIKNGVAKFGLRNKPPYRINTPYRPGDILYVRETWCERMGDISKSGKYIYKAHAQEQDELHQWVLDLNKWRPSIHMPKEAARLFLRVLNVRVERLQDINITGLQDEGLIKGGFLSQYTVMTTYDEHFSRWKELWDSTIKKVDLPLYGWDANPWVWVIEFERISKNETTGGT